MLGDIYYAIGLIAILVLFTKIMKFNKMNKVLEWLTKFKEITGKSPEDKDFRNKEEKDLFTGITALSSFEFIWVVVGLLTGNWLIFLLLIIYAFIINLINKPIKFTIIGKIINFHFLLLKFFMYLLLVINHFHLHYDIGGFVKSIIKL